MKKSIRSFLYILSKIAIFIVFASSAYFKLLSFDSFEFQLASIEFINLTLAGYLAFMIIFVEFFIGFYILFYKNSILFKYFSYLLIIVFTIYLAILLTNKGNNISCGCMGNKYDIKPFTAILKNLATLLMMYFVFNYNNTPTKWSNFINRYYFYIVLFGISISFLYTYYLSPIYFKFENSYENKGLTYLNIQSGIIEKSKYYKSDTFFIKNKQYLLAFLSMSCEHCKIAAQKLQIMNKEDINLPIFIVLNGDSSKVDAFRNDFKINKIPSTMLYGRDFIDIAGLELPKFFLVRNDTIQNIISTRDLSTSRLQKWMKN